MEDEVTGCVAGQDGRESPHSPHLAPSGPAPLASRGWALLEPPLSKPLSHFLSGTFSLHLPVCLAPELCSKLPFPPPSALRRDRRPRAFQLSPSQCRSPLASLLGWSLSTLNTFVHSPPSSSSCLRKRGTPLLSCEEGRLEGCIGKTSVYKQAPGREPPAERLSQSHLTQHAEPLGITTSD